VKRKTYYAHAMCIYGHLVESQELAAIRRGFKGSVVNPANYDPTLNDWYETSLRSRRRQGAGR